MGTLSPYGFGVQLRPRNGQLVTSHGGAIPGFVSYLAHYDETDLDVVILSNTPGLHVGSIARNIASWALDPQPETSSR